MAKTIYASASVADRRLVAEVLSLRARVAELEKQLREVQLENAAFEDEVRSLSVPQPPAVLA